MIVGSTVFNPGDMRTAVTLQKRGVNVDAGGYPTAAWIDIADVMVKWVNVHGSEAWTVATTTQRPDNLTSVQPATLMMRYRDDVDVTCSVLKGDTRYEIISLDNIHDENVLIELKVQRMRAG
jgi:head-tail adaptor